MLLGGEGVEGVVAGVGGQVAGYRIDAFVGRGGGGVVYRATHLRLGRTAALKLLAPELAADGEFQRRFEREALMAARLDHPHIVPVYDAGEAAGTLYLAMRFVEGPDLATVIGASRGGLDLARACVILEQVASALDAAHARGLVHCDVKPGNILLDRLTAAGSEHAYLSDFGLTRRSAGTLSGTVTGTPAFMAPERFRGVPAAPPIDIYALGCLAYACLTGSPPFDGDTVESVMAGHLYQPPPRISDRRAELPASVDTVLMKAIAKTPTDRYTSCGEFTTALRDAINSRTHPAPAPPSPPPPVPAASIADPPDPPKLTPRKWVSAALRRRTMVISGLAAALVAALVGGFLMFSSADSQAVATPLAGNVFALATDSAGGMYIATLVDPRIYKLEPSGTIKVIAGTGTKGYSGDGGPADKAQLSSPQGLAVDNAGNLYIADADVHRVRKIDPTGTITTIAGNGTQESAGDGGPVALSQIWYPTDVAVDRNGNIYVAEASGDRVRKIDQSGRISTVAGTGEIGFSGDGGPATKAQLGSPAAIAVDDAGILYIADLGGNNRVRKVDPAGTISTIVGDGTAGSTGDGGPATAAELDVPTDLAVDHAGNLYIADVFNDRIRKVDTGGRISTMAGTGIPGFSGDGGPATSAHLAIPRGVLVDRDGDIVIADSGSHRVRKVDHSGTISTIAGTGPDYPGDGGPATQAHLRNPNHAYLDKLGRLFISDSANNRVRRVDPNGVITTVAGTGAPGYSGDGGDATDAQLNSPLGLLVDPAGNLYIADRSNHRVRKVTPEGKITTVAGIGTGYYSGDGGPATKADLRFPVGLALDSDGNLYVSEGGNDRVRRIDRAGIITTVAGNGDRGFAGDGGPATQAQLYDPCQIQFDAAGNLYIAEEGNNRIRRVDRAGIITTLAGNGKSGFAGDGGPARDAQLANPRAVAVDSAGNVYFGDQNNHRIRKVDPTGRITTIAGTRTRGFSGDHGPATSAQLRYPLGLSIGADGSIYIADWGNNRIRKIDPSGVITTVVGPESSDG